MSDDTSQANVRPAPQGGALMPQLDPKSILILAVLGIGTASGGGIMSMFNSDRVSQEIRTLQTSIAGVERALIEIQSNERTRDRDGQRTDKRLHELETRVRRIEDHVGPIPRGGR